MSPDPLARIRLLFYDQQRWDLAERELRKHPELLVGNAEANAILGKCAYKREDFDEARAHLRRSLEIDPEFTNALCDLAVLEDKLATRATSDENRIGHRTEAERLIREAIRLENNCANYHAILASILVDKGQIRDALIAIEQALSINPDHVYSLQIKAMALLEWNMYREAVEPLTRALQIDPQEPWTHIYFFRAKDGRQTSEAHRHLERALELAPDDRVIREYCLRFHMSRLERIGVWIYVVLCISFLLYLALKMLKIDPEKWLR